MTSSFDPRGAYTALVTPFDDGGRIDGSALRRLLEFQLGEGVAGLAIGGTTSESATLEWEEHHQLLEQALAAAKGRGILAGTGSNNTRETIEATRVAKALGASAALVVDCYYNAPSSLELRTEYYEPLLEAVPEFPIVPYVIPARTGCALCAEDLALLALEHPERVVAVKEATGDLERMKRTRSLTGKRLMILSGDDPLIHTMMRDPTIAASGCVSVMSNIAPRAVQALVTALATANVGGADRLAKALAPLFRVVTIELKSTRVMPGGALLEVTDRFRNPVAVKTMMAGLGMIEPVLRRPLGRMSKRGVASCREALLEVHAETPEILRPIEDAFSVSVGARLADDGVWSALVR